MKPIIRAMDADNRPNFAGIAENIDLRVPPTPDVIAAVKDGLHRFGVVVFRDQLLTDPEQIAFFRPFGTLETAEYDMIAGEKRRLPNEMNDLSNLGADGEPEQYRSPVYYSRIWHSDGSFRQVPSKYSFLSARLIPGEGGNTEYADMRAAYATLPDDIKAQIYGRSCKHDVLFNKYMLGLGGETIRDTEQEMLKNIKEAWHPLVRRLPETGELALYVGGGSSLIEGMSLPDSRLLLLDLMHHATQREFVYAHQWRPNDAVMWDNRIVIHRGRAYDPTQKRDMHRVTVIGDAEEQSVAA